MNIILFLACFLYLPLSIIAFQSPILKVSSQEIKTQQTITISFLMEWILEQGEVLSISLPGYTTSTGLKEGLNIPGKSIAWGSVRLTPSLTFSGRWTEGNFFDPESPFSTSYLSIKLRPNIVITNKFYLVNITIFDTNGISIYCGYPDSFKV